MILKNTGSRETIYQLQERVEDLRGGFGEEDPVGTSYQDFYLDSYRSASDLEDLVNQESNCCERVRHIEPERLCQRGNDLIRTAASYPMV